MDITKAKSFLLICLLSYALCSIFTAKTFGQTVRRVDNSVTTSGNGQTWTGAYKHLWEALAEVNFIDDDWEIRVAKGTYTPQAQDLPFLITNKPGELAGNRIVLLGGYLGDAENNANPDLRDPKAFPTILSGDLLGNDLVPFTSDLDYLRNLQLTDNAFSVLRVLNSGKGNRIDGFIIERSAQGTDFGFLENRAGGGMLIRDSAIDVVNCTFRFNAVSSDTVSVPNGPRFKCR